jgi:hypothetical protein
MASCVNSYYGVTTKINPDGSCLREIYARGDSAFLSGNRSHNPYMFYPDSSWQITPLSKAAGKYNVKIGKTSVPFGEFASGLQIVDENLRALAAPQEILKRHSGWFYTGYTVKTVYPCILEKIPVAPDDYMSKDEQKMWFQGDFSAYTGMNGWELKNEMDGIENQFLIWYSRNVYEIYLETLSTLGKLSGNSPYISMLPEVKDSVFRMIVKNNNWGMYGDIMYGDINRSLDEYFQTTYFSDLYKNAEIGEQIDSIWEDRLSNDLFTADIEYKLVIPGKLISANTSLISGDTLTWKITAVRLIPSDYEITATFRTANVWAFVITILFAALSVCCLTKAFRRRKSK